MPLTGLLAGARAYGMFSAAQASDFQLIQSITVGSGGASSVTFSNIPQTFTHLQVRGILQTNRATFGRDLIRLQINGDTGNNYAWHQLWGDGSSAGSSAGTSDAQIRVGEVATTTAGSNFFGAVILDVLDYLSTSKTRTIRSLSGLDHNGLISGFGGTISLFSGFRNNTAAVTSLTFLPVNGTSLSQHSALSLYGVR